MKTTITSLLGATLLLSLAIGCSAETQDDDVASSTSSALGELSSECTPANGGYNGKQCGNLAASGPGSYCFRGACRKLCGVGILDSTSSLICGTNAACQPITGFLAGNGNQVGGLCYGSPYIIAPPSLPPLPAYSQILDSDPIRTCDNNVRLSECARGGSSLYKCVAPGGRSTSSPTNNPDLGYQWTRCSGSAQQCGCANAASIAIPTTCDNGVARDRCASDGRNVYKCVNPGGASQASVPNSQWRLCNAQCRC